MKEFNLKAALNGEPVMLRNKRKAFVLYDIRNYPALINKLGRRPLKGIVFTEDEYKYADAEWNESGVNSLVPFNIIGMWEEPKLTTEELMEKAFQEKLVLSRTASSSLCGCFEVIGKTLDGDYILQNCDNAELRFLREFYGNIEWSIVG